MTLAQRQQFRLKGYDTVFERNGKVFAVNSAEINNWSEEKKSDFRTQTDLVSFEDDHGDTVFYDPEYFQVDEDNDLSYYGTQTSGIPQPINLRCYEYLFSNWGGSSLDLGDWDMSRAESISCMFEACFYLENLSVRGWNLQNCEYATWLLEGCRHLKSIDLSGWNTPILRKLDFAFSGCALLQEIDLSNLDTHNLQSAPQLFKQCEHLKSVNLAGLNLSKVINLTGLFLGCSSLEKVNMHGVQTSSTLKCIANMFRYCESLESVDVSTLCVSSVKEFTNVFAGCSKLKSVSLQGWSVTSGEIFTNMFYCDESLEDVDLGVLKQHAVGPKTFNAFFGCNKLLNKYSYTDSSEFADDVFDTGVKQKVQPQRITI